MPNSMTAAIDAMRVTRPDDDPYTTLYDLQSLLGLTDLPGDLLENLCEGNPPWSECCRNARTLLACFMAEVDEETLQACIADWRFEL